LRSSDGVDFHVRRSVLKIASPFFKRAFSQPIYRTQESEREMIFIEAPSHLLERFLRVWYPGVPSVVSFNGLKELSEIIALAVKYEIESHIPILRKHLQGYLEEDPLGVFAIACTYGWSHVAKAAAKRSLMLPLRSLEGAGAAPQLLAYHSACSRAASSAGDISRTGEWVWVKCTKCSEAWQTQSVPAAWLPDHIARSRALLTERPGADLLDLSLLVNTERKAVACGGICATSGFKDLITFLVEKYVPAVNAAIEEVCCFWFPDGNAWLICLSFRSRWSSLCECLAGLPAPVVESETFALEC
ncbi:hypothetical protein B0H13DRAFT_1622593, partial [Mycena leptocephala]